MANTLKDIQKDISNDAVRRLVDLPEFTGELPPSSPVQGSSYGYTSGGLTPSYSNVIDKFSFVSNGDATNVGDLTESKSGTAGQSSGSNGYASGGTPAASTASNVIDKFPFASNTNATDVGDLTISRYLAAGQSSSESGYTSGGTPISSSNVIDKFPFASSFTTATDVGDLTLSRYSSAGQSSFESGYTSGGLNYKDTIDKFSFASNENATDVGELTVLRFAMTGQSSNVYGYTSGGSIGFAFSSPANARTNVIDKFSFVANVNATNVGDLTVARQGQAGQSSTESGYTSGGTVDFATAPPNSTVIDKFSFASEANATNVGVLTVSRYQLAGQQY